MPALPAPSTRTAYMRGLPCSAVLHPSCGTAFHLMAPPLELPLNGPRPLLAHKPRLLSIPRGLFVCSRPSASTSPLQRWTTIDRAVCVENAHSVHVSPGDTWTECACAPRRVPSRVCVDVRHRPRTALKVLKNPQQGTQITSQEPQHATARHDKRQAAAVVEAAARPTSPPAGAASARRPATRRRRQRRQRRRRRRKQRRPLTTEKMKATTDATTVQSCARHRDAPSASSASPLTAARTARTTAVSRGAPAPAAEATTTSETPSLC